MATPPNIIWIYCDELRTDALECYGNRFTRLQTPHIDSIAASGVLFEHSYCNSPVCVASRMSTLTGLYPEDTGVYNNEAMRPHYQLDRRCEMFPEIFARHGYITANFGKVHLPQGINPWMHHEPEGSYMNALYDGIPPEDLDMITVPGLPYIMVGGRYPGDRPFPPDAITRNAINWLRQTTEPYFVRLSYLQPHTPVFPPPPYDTLYADVDFPDTITTSDGLSLYERRFSEIVQAGLLTPEQIRRIQVAYHGLVAWLDAQIGLLIDYLRQHADMQNTIIILEADHGNALGEGGRLQKLTYAPEVHRVPRIISWQGTLPAGQRRSDICESLDTGRTLLDLAGIAAPETLKGRSLFSDPAPEAVYATLGYGFASSRAFPAKGTGSFDESHGWPRRACLRTQRYRLEKNVRINGETPTPDHEDMFLADMRHDPDETHNLADDPACADVRASLTALLDAHTSRAYTPPEHYTEGLETLK